MPDMKTGQEDSKQMTRETGKLRRKCFSINSMVVGDRPAELVVCEYISRSVFWALNFFAYFFCACTEHVDVSRQKSENDEFYKDQFFLKQGVIIIHLDSYTRS